MEQSPGVKISISDNLKKIITSKNVIGEITIKGENIAKGYCNISSENFKNGLYGDLGKIDKTGYVYFYGRKTK